MTVCQIMSKWKNNGDSLDAEYQFKNFQEALRFVNSVGKIAEIQNHHPDIKIYQYNRVSVSTTTHDNGNVVTDKDFRLADRIDKL